MKKLLLIALAAIFLLSCNKNIDPNNQHSSYIYNISTGLKDSLNNLDFANIDILKSVITKAGKNRNYVRIPFKGKDISKDFVLLQTETSGKITRGFIINLNKNAEEKGKEYEFNGFITKSSLDRKLITISPLTKGIITHSRSSRIAQRDISFPVPKDTIIWWPLQRELRIQS